MKIELPQDMSDTYISREAVIIAMCHKMCNMKEPCAFNCPEYNLLKSFPAADVRPVPAGGIGEMSDGYHTFNGLYYQRMVLFAALVKAHKDKAWKSWKHEDGNPCFGGGWFIVGIDTPEGSYTYHYDKMYWNLFECKELPTAKHWDGHTEKDVTRLLSLDVRPVVRGKWIWDDEGYHCSECFYHALGETGEVLSGHWHYCPNCGADMREISITCKGLYKQNRANKDGNL